MDTGGLFLLAESAIVAVLRAGSAANLFCFRILGRHNRILRREGLSRVSTYPASARLKFGDGRLLEVRHAAYIPVGIAGNKGMFSAFALEADIPAVLRKGAYGAPCVQLDFSRDISTLRRKGVVIPLGVNRVGLFF